MKKEILNEINRLLSQLEQDPHLPSNKEVDEGVKNVLEHLKGFVENRRENGGDDFAGISKIVSEGLEEAARNYPSAIHVVSPQWSGEVRTAFKAGAKWQKEQMLKDAVEEEVYLYHSYNRDATAILVDTPKENFGDKVKIIILKEDKEDEE